MVEREGTVFYGAGMMTLVVAEALKNLWNITEMMNCSL